MKKVAGLFGIGDIHGMLKEMIINLEDQGVIDDNADWAADEGTLVLTGDLTDRGPEGYEVVKKVYDLKEQAEKQGGKIVVTTGNHDVGFLNCAVYLCRRPELKKMFENALLKTEVHDRKAAYTTHSSDPAKYRETKNIKIGEALNICMSYPNTEVPLGIEEADMPDEGREIHYFKDQLTDMLTNGMNLEDLLRVCESAELMTWAVSWPAMYAQDGVLFQHCDSTRVYKYLEREGQTFDGSPMEKANYATTVTMLSPSIAPGKKLWDVMTSGRYWEDDATRVIPGHLNYFAPGATKVAHGHTRLFGEFQPSEYANNMAVNLDVGLAYAPHHTGKTGRMVNLTEHAIAHRAKKSRA